MATTTTTTSSTADELYEYDRLPPDRTRLDVCDWLRVHGIEPNDVAVPGWIERRPGARQIAFESYEWVTRDDGTQTLRLDDQRTDAIRHAAVVQLEARPLPFPASVGLGRVIWRGDE